jgi:hypothetical protein
MADASSYFLPADAMRLPRNQSGANKLENDFMNGLAGVVGSIYENVTAGNGRMFNQASTDDKNPTYTQVGIYDGLVQDTQVLPTLWLHIALIKDPAVEELVRVAFVGERLDAIGRTRVIFDTRLPSPIAPLSTVPLIGFKPESLVAFMRRFGIGITFEYEMLQRAGSDKIVDEAVLELFKTHIDMRRMYIVAAIISGAYAEHVTIRRTENRLIQIVEFSQAVQQSVSRFDVLHRDKDAILDIHSQALERALNKGRADPPDAILMSLAQKTLCTQGTINTTYSNAGQDGQEKLKSGPWMFNNLGVETGFPFKAVTLAGKANGMIIHELNSRIWQGGAYYMPPAIIDEEKSNQYLDTGIYDFGGDSIKTLTIENGLKHNLLFNQHGFIRSISEYPTQSQHKLVEAGHDMRDLPFYYKAQRGHIIVPDEDHPYGEPKVMVMPHKKSKKRTDDDDDMDVETKNLEVGGIRPAHFIGQLASTGPSPQINIESVFRTGMSMIRRNGPAYEIKIREALSNLITYANYFKSVEYDDAQRKFMVAVSAGNKRATGKNALANALYDVDTIIESQVGSTPTIPGSLLGTTGAIPQYPLGYGHYDGAVTLLNTSLLPGSEGQLKLGWVKTLLGDSITTWNAFVKVLGSFMTHNPYYQGMLHHGHHSRHSIASIILNEFGIGDLLPVYFEEADTATPRVDSSSPTASADAIVTQFELNLQDATKDMSGWDKSKATTNFAGLFGTWPSTFLEAFKTITNHFIRNYTTNVPTTQVAKILDDFNKYFSNLTDDKITPELLAEKTTKLVEALNAENPKPLISEKKGNAIVLFLSKQVPSLYSVYDTQYKGGAKIPQIQTDTLGTPHVSNIYHTRFTVSLENIPSIIRYNSKATITEDRMLPSEPENPQVPLTRSLFNDDGSDDDYKKLYSYFDERDRKINVPGVYNWMKAIYTKKVPLFRTYEEREAQPGHTKEYDFKSNICAHMMEPSKNVKLASNFCGSVALCPNFQENLMDAYEEADDLKRILCLSVFTTMLNQHQLLEWDTANVRLPVGMLFAQPFVTLHTESLIAMASGERTMTIFEGEPHIYSSVDASTLRTDINMRLRFGNLIDNSANLILFPDTNVTGHRYGKGASILDKEHVENAMTGNPVSGMGSIIPFLVPVTLRPEEPLIFIPPDQGQMRDFMDSRVSVVEDLSEVVMPGAHAYNLIYGFSKYLNPQTEAGDPNHWQPNYYIVPGTCAYRDGDGHLLKKIQGSDHCQFMWKGYAPKIGNAY